MKSFTSLPHDEKALLSLAAEMGLIDLSEEIQSKIPTETYQPPKPRIEPQFKFHENRVKLLT